MAVGDPRTVPERSVAPRDRLERVRADSPVPLWHQIFGVLAQQIANGTLPPDSSIGTEKDLGARFGVSRITVRRALAELVAEGWLRRARPREPLRVRDRTIQQELTRLVGFFTEDVVRMGIRLETRVVAARKVAASDIAEHLEVEPSHPVYRVERLYLGDDEPLALQVSYIPIDRYPDLLEEDLSGSLLVLLEGRGHIFSSAQQRIAARLPLSVEARLLSLQPNEVVFEVRRTTVDPQRRPIEYLRGVLAARRYELTMRLYRGEPVPGFELVPLDGRRV